MKTIAFAIALFLFALHALAIRGQVWPVPRFRQEGRNGGVRAGPSEQQSMATIGREHRRSVRILVKVKQMRYRVRFSNYRKFRVETTIKPAEPGS